MTQDTLTVEEIVDTVLKELKEDFTGGDMHDWEYGKFRLRPLLTNTLTTYGNARYEEGVKEEMERCKRCYEANTRHNPHSLSEPYSPNYKNANTATTHISYLDYTDFVPKHVSPPTSHLYIINNTESLETYGNARYDDGVKAERQFILNVLDGIDIADGECNTKAIRKCLEARYVCRDYGPCYATEEENDWFVTLGAPRRCNQCKLEGNHGVCDKKDCKNYPKNKQLTP